MQYTAIATDYDGTLAHDGKVDESTISALLRANEAGLVTILVTGRELADLFNTFSRTALFTVLEELGLGSEDVAGIGDAENDQDFLEACGLSVAVANALPVVKEMADIVTQHPRGAGVAELIDLLLCDDRTVAGRSLNA